MALMDIFYHNSLKKIWEDISRNLPVIAVQPRCLHNDMLFHFPLGKPDIISDIKQLCLDKGNIIV